MEFKTSKATSTHEVKRETVRLLETRGERTVADVAASLGVTEHPLHA
jgi:hypothetical protein